MTCHSEDMIEHRASWSNSFIVLFRTDFKWKFAYHEVPAKLLDNKSTILESYHSRFAKRLTQKLDGAHDLAA